jgi:hypothetical protein
MIKSVIRNFGWGSLVVLALAVCSTFAWCQDDSVTLTSAGSDPQDGIYMSPYYATVNGNANTTVVCDDFADESNVGTSWYASAISMSSLTTKNVGDTLWGSWFGSAAGGGFAASTIITWYQEAAWLTLGLLSSPSNSSQQEYYSAAIWAVFDPNSVLNWFKSNGNTAGCQAIFGNNCTSTTASGSSLLALAENDYKTGNYSNLVILTPLTGKNGSICSPALSGHGNCPAQEFFEVVAEGGSALLYLLLAGTACFAAMFFRSRQQQRPYVTGPAS